MTNSKGFSYHGLEQVNGMDRFEFRGPGLMCEGSYPAANCSLYVAEWIVRRLYDAYDAGAHNKALEIRDALGIERVSRR